MKKKYLALGLLLVAMASIAVLSLSSTSGEKAGNLKVNLTVDYGQSVDSRTVNVINGSSVFNVLNSTYIVDYREYTGLGVLVNSINGVSSNQTHYWFYYVNSEFAQVAADQYRLYEDSAVLFKLMEPAGP